MCFRKGSAMLRSLAVLVGVLAAAGCIPRPEEPVAFLAAPDSILIQMVNGGGPARTEVAERLAVPDFTLYGDGTLIFARPDADGRPRLLRAELPEDALRDLLEFVFDRDFLDFPYDHENPDATDATTTFLYFHAKTEAYAFRAYGLDVELAEGALSGDARRQFERLATIKVRLDELDPETEGGRVLGDFVPEAVVLVVQPTEAPNLVGSPPAWPFPEIDVGEIAPLGSGIVERRISGATATKLAQQLVPSAVPILFEHQGRWFAVGYRPVLPFEENFPEFDE